MLKCNHLPRPPSVNCLIHIAKYSFFIATTLRFLYPWYRLLCIRYGYMCVSFRYGCIFNIPLHMYPSHTKRVLTTKRCVSVTFQYIYMILFYKCMQIKSHNCSNQNQVCIDIKQFVSIGTNSMYLVQFQLSDTKKVSVAATIFLYNLYWLILCYIQY
jgi:hypothetical protein